MNTGCPACDRDFINNGERCPKHKLEYLKWVAESAQKDYKEAKEQYEQEQERELKCQM